MGNEISVEGAAVENCAGDCSGHWFLKENIATMRWGADDPIFRVVGETDCCFDPVSRCFLIESEIALEKEPHSRLWRTQIAQTERVVSRLASVDNASLVNGPKS